MNRSQVFVFTPQSRSYPSRGEIIWNGDLERRSVLVFMKRSRLSIESNSAAESNDVVGLRKVNSIYRLQCGDGQVENIPAINTPRVHLNNQPQHLIQNGCSREGTIADDWRIWKKINNPGCGAVTSSEHTLIRPFSFRHSAEDSRPFPFNLESFDW